MGLDGGVMGWGGWEMSRVLRVPLDESRSFLAEVDELQIPDEDLVSLTRTEGPVDRAARGLDESLNEIVPVVQRFSRGLRISKPLKSSRSNLG